MKFDLAMTDDLLATTRAVRKRLDLDRKVPREVIMECLELAVQAPTGSNSQGWRWLIVDDAKKKQALADLYRKGGEAYLTAAGEQAKQAGNVQTQRVYDSAMYLIDILHKVPMHVIPCLEGRPRAGTPATLSAATTVRFFRPCGASSWRPDPRPGHRADDVALLYGKKLRRSSAFPTHSAGRAAADRVHERHRFQTRGRPPVSNITHWNTW